MIGKETAKAQFDKQGQESRTLANKVKDFANKVKDTFF